jgi:RNA polymerase sigma-70 factor, ECF subfamily
LRSPGEITELLVAWGNGDESALGTLVPIVEAELHRLAQHYLNHERAGHTLQPTALVNEAYVRLIEWKGVQWRNRAHFLGVSAQLMRRILVDYARRHRRLKRGGDDAIRVSFANATVSTGGPELDLLDIDEALTRLAVVDPRKSQIVELRFFGGLSVEETAEALTISPRTVKREWSLAQAWLYCALRGEQSDDA